MLVVSLAVIRIHSSSGGLESKALDAQRVSFCTSWTEGGDTSYFLVLVTANQPIFTVTNQGFPSLWGPSTLLMDIGEIRPGIAKVLATLAFPYIHDKSAPGSFIDKPLLHAATAQPQTKLPKIAFGTLLDVMFKLVAILTAILLLDLLQVFRLPMQTHQPADQEFRAVFTSLRNGLVEEQSVADGPVEDAVEDVGKGFTLYVPDSKSVTNPCKQRKGGLARRTTRFLDF